MKKILTRMAAVTAATFVLLAPLPASAAPSNTNEERPPPLTLSELGRIHVCYVMLRPHHASDRGVKLVRTACPGHVHR